MMTFDEFLFASLSATSQPEWLKSVDTAEQHAEWVRASRLKTNDPTLAVGESEAT